MIANLPCNSFVQCDMSYVGITINEYALFPLEKRETNSEEEKLHM